LNRPLGAFRLRGEVIIPRLGSSQISEPLSFGVLSHLLVTVIVFAVWIVITLPRRPPWAFVVVAEKLG
jgi:hypothetical protein|tara:strand:- start:98 stop:301 length:204 start_codon:yes stop_codon:yes gene_type:complete